MKIFALNNLVLLRIHFSLFLLPVFLFAVSQAENLQRFNTWLLFFILHFLVYPASNGYNSYMDRDESPIGGLKNPPMADSGLFYLTLAMDFLSLAISLVLGWTASVMVLVYIVASRAYSYRGIRIKKYPYAGFLTVAIFQGGFTYLLTYYHVCLMPDVAGHGWAMLSSSLLIGGIYPMTQIYQHAADLKDGVVTLSYKLGYTGTFIFCASCFAGAMLCMFVHFFHHHNLNSFYIMQVILFPVICFFLFWFYQVWKDNSKADFRNTMWMNLIASGCLNICFLYFIMMN